MKSKSKIPCIPIEGSISYEDWLKGRRYRRELSKLVGPGVIRRKTSSKDRRLKKLFAGERGLPFTPTEKLGNEGSMTRVTTRIKVSNWDDIALQAVGARQEKPRAIETGALVDTGAVKFYLRSSVIRELGLRPVGEIRMRTMSNRSESRIVFSPVALEIQGRTGRFDAVEIPDSLPNIVGQIPLEDLDWVVDCRKQKLIPNPEHKHGELADEFYEPASILDKRSISKNLSLSDSENHLGQTKIKK